VAPSPALRTRASSVVRPVLVLVNEACRCRVAYVARIPSGWVVYGTRRRLRETRSGRRLVKQPFRNLLTATGSGHWQCVHGSGPLSHVDLLAAAAQAEGRTHFPVVGQEQSSHEIGNRAS